MLNSRFHHLNRCGVFLLLLLLAPSAWSLALLNDSSAQIQARLTQVKNEMNTLPFAHPCTAQSQGYSSQTLASKNPVLPIEIHFKEAAAIDLVVLMPTLFKGDNFQLEASDFPEHFFIERLLADGSAECIADFRDAIYAPPDMGPQLFPCANPKLSVGLRITITQTQRRRRISLAEVFAFAGEWNVALNASVQVDDPTRIPHTWAPEFLVDGISSFLPLARDAAIQPVVPFRGPGKLTLIFDLGQPREIDEFRIWPVMWTPRNNSPFSSGKGFPQKVRLDQIDRTAPQNPKLLYEQNAPPRPGSNPLIQRISRTTSRYFSLDLQEGFYGEWNGAGRKILLSEIELLNHGLPLREIKVTALSAREMEMNPESLVDGIASEGHILTERSWLQNLRRRMDLQKKMHQLEAQLERTRQQEKAQGNILMMSAGALIIILLLLIWIVRLRAKSRAASMRDQIACDLHDELGANLSSLAHSAEMTKELINTSDPLILELLNETIQGARHTAHETRQFIRLLEDRQHGQDMESHIRKIAYQLLGSLNYTCQLDAANELNVLNPARKWDLLFFLKESLNNIMKHAQADHVEIEIGKAGAQLWLRISDNGCGIPADRFPLVHLERRTKRLKAEINVDTQPKQGTRITLTLNKWKNR